jgi:Family of unknown function (DUF6011)/DNA N-6-adenine-methyltransferase (Dam)
LQEISLPDLDAAKLWILRNQRGRRNLTPNGLSFVRGTEYNLLKRQGKRTDLTSHQNDGKSQSAAQLVAAEYHVGSATIERDGAYVTALHLLAAALGTGVTPAQLVDALPLPRQDVPVLAERVEGSHEAAAVVREALQGDAPEGALRALVTAPSCGICHRPLSDPASISRGIGPICAGHGSGGSRSSPALGGATAPATIVRVSADGWTSYDPAPPAPVLTLEPETPVVDETPAPPILHEVLDPEPPEAAGHRNRWGSVTTPLAAEPVPGPSRREYSGDPEWYTPPEVLALVREVLGTIDVDPASCALAQQTVQATTFYTMADSGLAHPWLGTVFCNPPYHMPDIARFCGKLLEELDAGHTTAAILLTNGVTDTGWFHAVAPRAAAICFTEDRVRFTHATRDGLRPCQGQALFYFGPDVARFCAVFAPIGILMQALPTQSTAAQLELPAPAHEPGAEATVAPPPLPSACPQCAKPVKRWLRRKGTHVCPTCNYSVESL